MKGVKGYQVKEDSVLNPLITAYMNIAGSLSNLAKHIGINKSTISQALHNKIVSFNSKLKIARFFKLETELISCPFCNPNYYANKNGTTKQ